MNTVPGLRGPEGVRQRMQEIQAKLDAAFGPSFQAALSSQMPAPISGNIGGTQPFDPLGAGASLSSRSTPELKKMIADAAQKAGVDEGLFDSLVSVESGYDSGARSRAGALGLCQLMPGTAQALGVTNPLDPQQNLDGGARYLAQLLKQFKTTPVALAAYNAGPEAVLKAGNSIPNYPETQGYVKRVLDLFNARQPNGGPPK